MALTALEQLEQLGELNTEQSMIEILQRCQPHTRNRWRNKALEPKSLKDDYPEFKDFTKFVQREASEACDPVYGHFPAKQREDVKVANFHTVAYAPGPVTSSASRRKPARAADNAVQYNVSTLSQSTEVKSTTVSFCLTSGHDDVKLDVRTALTVNSIHVRYPSNVIDVQQYPYFRYLDVPRLSRMSGWVDILIDMDNADTLMPLEVRCSDKQKRMPYATRILFGSLNGPSHFVDLEQRISKLWEVEQCDEDIQSLSYDDRKVQAMWQSEVKLEDGHYVVPIP